MAAHSKKIIRVITLDVDESDAYTQNSGNRDISHAADDDTPTGDDIDLPLEIANLAVEKEIFLRACLQMLDKKEALLRSGLQSPSTDIIKAGILRKSAPSSLNNMWRVKYAELRHGIFSYSEDITSSGKAAKKKIITLNVATCVCRPSRLYEGCAFELSGADGGSGMCRLWLAASLEDRNAWIEAILSAMVGSAGDFVSGDGAMTATERDDISARKLTSAQSGDISSDSLPNEMYSRDVETFQLIQERVKAADSPEAYRSTLAAYANHHLVTIPVSIVKDAVHASLFYKGAQDMATSSARSIGSKLPKSVSTQSSQAWKDLHRDMIIVNDEMVSGVQGPEAMVGALVRHILQHVKMLKMALQHRNVVLDADDLNESHVLHCAREVLLACNRTQSGGDTYYCVESLLCNRDYAVLTPNASEAEPMRITVSLVENKSRQKHENEVISGDGAMSEAPDDKCDASAQQHCDRELKSPQSEAAVMFPMSVSPSTAASGGIKDDSSGNIPSSPCVTPQSRPSREHLPEEDTDSEEATHTLQRANSLFSHHSDIPGAEALHSTLYMNSLKDKQAAMLQRRAMSGQHDIDEEEDEETETTTSSDLIAAQSRPVSMSGIPDPLMGVAHPQHRRASSNPNPLFVDISDPNLLVTHDASGRVVHDSPPPNYYELTEKNVIEGTTLQWNDEGTVAMSELTMETAANNLNFVSFRKRAKSLLRTNPSAKPPVSPAPAPLSLDDDSLRSNKDMRRGSKLLKMGFSTPRKKDESATATSKSKFPKIPGTGKLKKALRSAGKHMMMPKKLLIAEEEDDGSTFSSTAVSMCIKIQVTARSQYRLCNADPQNETDDNWAVVTGDFQQFFFLKPYCNGHPAVSDRLVSMRLENVLRAQDMA